MAELFYLLHSVSISHYYILVLLFSILTQCNFNRQSVIRRLLLNAYNVKIAGLIGPDGVANIEAVQKVTGILKIPHIVKKPFSSPFVHHLAKESDYYVTKVLKILIL